MLEYVIWYILDGGTDHWRQRCYKETSNVQVSEGGIDEFINSFKNYVIDRYGDAGRITPSIEEAHQYVKVWGLASKTPPIMKGAEYKPTEA